MSVFKNKIFDAIKELERQEFEEIDYLLNEMI